MKPNSKLITIKEICFAMKLSRATFYRRHIDFSSCRAKSSRKTPIQYRADQVNELLLEAGHIEERLTF